MGLLNFYKLPVNTLVGANWSTFKRLTAGRQVDKKWRTKFFLTKCVCRILSPVSVIQNRRYRKELQRGFISEDPLFILGHWRSGTTFVHNVFACDRHFGYCTTYQTVFPHLMMFGQPFFKKVMDWIMPDKRPTDGLDLAPDLPQEEEFALSNMMPLAYYNWWFFPKNEEEYARRFLTMEEMTEEERKEWEENFRKLVNIGLWNTGGTQFLSKNPPHTGRISELLKMYPNAKFIYLVRNPYTVFESTRNFYTNTLIPLKLHEYPVEEIEQQILRTYSILFDRYEADKALIPEGHLIEVKFEDFEADPMGMTERIYRELGLRGWEESREAIAQYVGAKKGHKKRKYDYDPRTIELVESHWMKAIEKWGYHLQENED